MKQSPEIVGLGAMLWDIFPDATHFGGAPANFACHASMLGGQVSMVSCVGRDQLGFNALEFLQQYGVNTTTIAQSDDYPTGTVLVTLDQVGKPNFEIKTNVAWDAVPWSTEIAQLALETDAVCFGSLDQRSEMSRRTIQQFLKTTKQDCWRIFDINLRQHYYSPELIDQSLKLANILKLNQEELSVIESIIGLRNGEVDQLSQLKKQFELELVILTKGEKGSVLVSNQGVLEHPGLTIKVQDTVGAGDAFTATLAIGLLQGIDLEIMNQHANRVAAYVCSQSGAVPSLPPELLEFGTAHGVEF